MKLIKLDEMSFKANDTPICLSRRVETANKNELMYIKYFKLKTCLEKIKIIAGNRKNLPSENSAVSNVVVPIIKGTLWNFPFSKLS